VLTDTTITLTDSSVSLGTCRHCSQEEEEEEEEDFICKFTKSNLFCYQMLITPLLATLICGTNSQTSPQTTT
jgi:hypothetical protein